MKIKLDDKWALTNDERQYFLSIVSERTNKETGEKEEYFRTQYSYPTKEAVIKQWITILERTEPGLDSWEKVLNFQKKVLYPKLEEIGKKVNLCF